MFMKYELLDWIDIKKLNWRGLSSNHNAIDLLSKNVRRIRWHSLSFNKNGFELIKKHFTKICNIKSNQLYIPILSRNKGATEFFRKHGLEMNDEYFLTDEDSIDYIEDYLYGRYFYHLNWVSEDECFSLSGNKNAVHILIKHPHLIDFVALSSNKSKEAINILNENINKIDWDRLSSNYSAIDILLEHQDKINWYRFSSNKNKKAIALLRKNLHLVDWECLSGNESAISIIKDNLDKVHWSSLSYNEEAIDILRENQDKIIWSYFSLNKGIFKAVYDYSAIRKHFGNINKELIELFYHPKRINFEYLYEDSNDIQFTKPVIQFMKEINVN